MACLHSCRRQSAGGSLIEVLVSVLVLSIGLLAGLAAVVCGAGISTKRRLRFIARHMA